MDGGVLLPKDFIIKNCCHYNMGRRDNGVEDPNAGFIQRVVKTDRIKQQQTGIIQGRQKE